MSDTSEKEQDDDGPEIDIQYFGEVHTIKMIFKGIGDYNGNET